MFNSSNTGPAWRTAADGGRGFSEEQTPPTQSVQVGGVDDGVIVGTNLKSHVISWNYSKQSWLNIYAPYTDKYPSWPYFNHHHHRLKSTENCRKTIILPHVTLFPFFFLNDPAVRKKSQKYLIFVRLSKITVYVHVYIVFHEYHNYEAWLTKKTWEE